MTNKDFNKKKIPLLNQIDEGIHFDDIDWNKNAFQTLLTSNLPTKTICFYAIDVALRQLENSLYEPYWDVTTDALNDLTQFLFHQSSDKDLDSYLYEAKCQLLLFAGISLIKMNTIRRRSINEAKMSCATISLLLFQQTKPYEISSQSNEYSSCIRSMYHRYLKRIFILVQWLPTLSKAQLNDLETNYERYIGIFLEQLFSTVSLNEKVNSFIDQNLFGHQIDDDETSNSFVFVRRLPEFDEKLIQKFDDFMNMGLTKTLNQLNQNGTRKLICCIWTLCCMIESNHASLPAINGHIIREHFSLAPIDFNQKPIVIESLNERDVLVFLLLCAQQNVHLHGDDSVLHPYLLYSVSHLCTQQQKNWWQTAMEKTPWNEFLEHLCTIRLDDDRISQYPPKLILLKTAQILFQSAVSLYEQSAKRAASSYEQYALKYFQVAKANKIISNLSDSTLKSNIQGNKSDKLFFFYAPKTLQTDEKFLEQLIDQCEKLSQQCQQLKLLPEPPRTSSPTKEQQKEINISNVLSPVVTEKEQRKSEFNDSTLFATPPSNKSRDIECQTFVESPSPVTKIEEIIQTQETPSPPYVDMVFAHMNGVNQWITKFCNDNDLIQNDIQMIRDRLEKINRITTQMMFSNTKIYPTETREKSSGFYPPH